jgi:molybdate-binding protein/DNA-binding transcriptional regulator YhcF (GntR family)
MFDDIICKIKIDFHSQQPIYQQLIGQIQQLISAGQIKRGEHLPSVRHLGDKLNVSPNTVARAYLELERDQIVVTKRGGGTIVSPSGDFERLRDVRQAHLYKNIRNEVIRFLSQGYEPEQMEAAFYTSLESWREENSPKIGGGAGILPEFFREGSLRITGSHDIALNILVTLLKQKAKDIAIELNNVGSLRGLISLSEGKSEIAGIHLLDEETKEYNVPFIKRFFPGQKVAIINLVYRKQGLMVMAGNPRHIKGISSLPEPGLRFVNRQKGSGTRVLLDMQLKDLGIFHSNIKGYETELDNHLAVHWLYLKARLMLVWYRGCSTSCGLDFLPVSI